jgi:hypothetical protein
MKNKITIMICALLIVGCASTAQKEINAGNREMAAGNQVAAIKHYYKCAEELVPACMTKVGKIQYDHGNQDLAIKWFNFGARFGDQHAVANLQKLGQTVPPADMIKQEYRNTEDGVTALGLLAAMAQGYAGNNGNTNCTAIDLGGGIYSANCR